MCIYIICIFFIQQLFPFLYLISPNKLLIFAGQDLISHFSYIIEPTTIKNIKSAFNKILLSGQITEAKIIEN